MSIEKLDDIVNKYNNSFNSTVKMKHIDVKSSTYTDFDIENNEKVINLKLMTM